MGMGDEDRVQAVHPRPHQLQSELGRRVHEQPPSVLFHQQPVPRAVIAARLDREFSYRYAELDPVLRLFSAWEVDVDTSIEVYRDFHGNREAGLQQDLALLQGLRPDLVLADIPYRILLAAQQSAEKALEGASEETDVARAQAELEEARARYRAAQKLKGKR